MEYALGKMFCPFVLQLTLFVCFFPAFSIYFLADGGEMNFSPLQKTPGKKKCHDFEKSPPLQ